MIEVSDECAAVLDGGTFTLQCRVSITRAGSLLVDNLPVVAGREEFDDTLRVPERVEFTLPRFVDGEDISPQAEDDPLAPFGQRAHIKLGIGVGNEVVEWIDRGEFLLTDVDYDGDTIRVTAAGLLYLIDEARLLTSYAPTGTFTTTLRALVEPALTVIIDPAVTALDRSVPANVNDDEDRLQCLENLLTAWPARAQMTPAGYLAILPATTYPDGGFVQRYNDVPGSEDLANIAVVTGSMSRAGAVNTVVVRGNASDGYQVLGVAFDKSGGPTSAYSAFSPLPVPEFYASPLIDTYARAQAAAVSRLAQRATLAARRYSMNVIPDPRFLGGDVVDYRPNRDNDRSIPLLVERLIMPYTAGSGPMHLTGREWS